MATSIGNHLPLAGGTLSGHVSGTAITMSGIISASSVVAPNGTFGTKVSTAAMSMSGDTSAADVYCSGVAINVDALTGKDFHIAGAAVADIVSLTDAASISVDFNSGQNFIVQLAGNRTLLNPSNCVAGQTGSIILVQDGTGSRTLSFSTNWDFPTAGTAPTLSTGVSAVDRLDYIVYTSTNVQAIATLDLQ
jgi:hypothetical protein